MSSEGSGGGGADLGVLGVLSGRGPRGRVGRSAQHADACAERLLLQRQLLLRLARHWNALVATRQPVATRHGATVTIRQITILLGRKRALPRLPLALRHAGDSRGAQVSWEGSYRVGHVVTCWKARRPPVLLRGLGHAHVVDAERKLRNLLRRCHETVVAPDETCHEGEGGRDAYSR